MDEQPRFDPCEAPDLRTCLRLRRPPEPLLWQLSFAQVGEELMRYRSSAPWGNLPVSRLLEVPFTGRSEPALALGATVGQGCSPRGAARSEYIVAYNLNGGDPADPS